MTFIALDFPAFERPATATSEPVSLHHPLEPTPLGAAADLHPLTDLEHVDRELLSGLVLPALLRLELREDLRDVVETRPGGMARPAGALTPGDSLGTFAQSCNTETLLQRPAGNEP